MNRDDIIRMAQEAGLLEIIDDAYQERADWGDYVERFAALVAAAGAEAEREACAKVCESIEQDPYEDRLYRSDFADAIRARSKE